MECAIVYKRINIENVSYYLANCYPGMGLAGGSDAGSGARNGPYVKRGEMSVTHLTALSSCLRSIF